MLGSKYIFEIWGIELISHKTIESLSRQDSLLDNTIHYNLDSPDISCEPSRYGSQRTVYLLLQVQCTRIEV